MTIFPRLLRPIQLRTAQRASTTVAANSSRSYSFFSSKSGSRSIGASTKPPRSVAASKGSSSTASSNPNSNTTSNDEDGSTSSLTSEDASSASSTTAASSVSPVDPIAQSSPFQPPFQPHHLALSPNDLKLHQFFSLHRPLFLSQPSSSLFESSSTLRLPNSASAALSSGYSAAQAGAEQASTSSDAFEDPPEASAEADADAARLLARALVINRVGGTIRWDETMRRLGWKGEDSKEVLTMSVEMVGGTSSGADMEGENVVDMDSVKRKRRKKMKKHKLKKRRKVCPLF